MAGPNVRVQDELKAEAVAYARSLGISLNALVAVALREYLDARRMSAALAPGPAIAPDSQPAAGTEPGAASAAPAPPRNGAPPEASAARPQTRGQPPAAKRAGPNAPCPCGSGKKTKQCHPEMCGR